MSVATQLVDPVVEIIDLAVVEPVDPVRRKGLKPCREMTPFAAFDEGIGIALINGVGEKQRNCIVQRSQFGYAGLASSLVENANLLTPLCEAFPDCLQLNGVEFIMKISEGIMNIDEFYKG